MNARLYILIAVGLGLSADTALANQPPGPMIMLSEVLILPIMIVVSLAAGYYTVQRATVNEMSQVGENGDKPASSGRGWRILAVILLIFFSGMHETFGGAVALGFGIYALERAGRMIWWGSAKSMSATSTAVASGRLLAGGLILSLATIFLIGQIFAFLYYWPEISQPYREERFRKFVSFQMAYAERQQAQTGKRTFHRLSPEDDPGLADFYMADRASYKRTSVQDRIEVVYGVDNESFTAYLSTNPRPEYRLPFFPYNYLTSQPSLRADESADIRMMRVHHNGQRCPPEAPVVWRVTEAEIEAAQQVMDTVLKTHH